MFCSFTLRYRPKQFIVRDSQFFLKIYPSFVSLLVSVLFCQTRNISIHLSCRSVILGVRPCTLTMQHFYSFVSQICRCWCPFFPVGHVIFLIICLPGLLLLGSAFFLQRYNISIHIFFFFKSVVIGIRFFRHTPFLFISFPHLLLVVAALFR